MDQRAPFTIGLTSATSIGLSPRWVQYSGVSLAARAAAEFLADSATMHTHGDQAPTLDRERLAYHLGIGRADKVAPVLDELTTIGFLTIFSGGVDPSTGKRRQRRDSLGRPIPDRFSITLEPPVRYVGPVNRNESDADFAVDRDAAYRAAEEAGRRVRTGNITIRRTSVGRLVDPQVGTDTEIRGQVEGADPGIRGQRVFPQVGTDTEIRGQVEGADPGIRGQRVFPQVGTDTEIRGLLQIDRSSISEGEIDRSIEPVPGGAAEPPATGMDENQAAAVRRVVRELPWRQWSAEHGVPLEFRRAQADAVQDAMCSAMVQAGLTLQQVTDISVAAISEATKNPVVYLAGPNGALRPPKLARWVAWLEEEPLSDSPLPLPGSSTSRGAVTTSAKSGKGAATGRAEIAVAKRVLRACSTCGAREGEGPGGRTVERVDGRHRPCPDCRPAA